MTEPNWPPHVARAYRGPGRMPRAFLQFEFVNYGRDGCEHPEGLRFTQGFRSDSAAKSAAGRLAKRVDGPVDLARTGDAPWDERYITTAAPSDVHAAGYRFERLT